MLTIVITTYYISYLALEYILHGILSCKINIDAWRSQQITLVWARREREEEGNNRGETWKLEAYPDPF